MRLKLFATGLAGLCLPADAALADYALPVLECKGPAPMDPYYIKFDLPARKADVQRRKAEAARAHEGEAIEKLSDDSIEWTGVMRFRFDRRTNLLHETAVFTTDVYICTPMKAE